MTPPPPPSSLADADKLLAFGQTALAAYRDSLSAAGAAGRVYVPPPWALLSPLEQAAWEAAGRAAHRAACADALPPSLRDGD
jgi:hypothetical protein